MPRIRRYYPASHMLNRDPEFVHLRRQYADWMGYVWHEMLAWGDHTEGTLKGDPTEIALTLAQVSLQIYPRRAAHIIEKAFRYMQDCGWIEIRSDRIVILNHAKYHGSREDIKSHEESKKVPPTNPTNQPTNQTKEEPPIVPHKKSGGVSEQSEPAPAESEPPQKKGRERYSAGFSRFCEIHPFGGESRAEAWEVWQRKKLEDVADEICLATEAQKAWPQKARDGFEYFPRMPSYLRKERWKDEPPEANARVGPPTATEWKSLKVLNERNRRDEEEQRHGNPSGNPQSAHGPFNPVSLLGKRVGGSSP